MMLPTRPERGMAMPKAILLCGKVGCGKTTYAGKLMREHVAVLLSADEIMLALFGNDAGDMHSYYAERTQRYLYQKSLEILGQGIDVILDWGFWTKASRKAARDFFDNAGYTSELHYITVSDEDRIRNLAKRNEEFLNGDRSAYYVDGETAKIFDSRFEEPTDDEVDLTFENKHKE